MVRCSEFKVRGKGCRSLGFRVESEGLQVEGSRV
jgi:hypothetical protein